MKKCGKCKLEKIEEDFSPSHYKKSGGWCKNCNKLYMVEFKKLNVDKIKAYQKEYDVIYYQNNKLKILDDKKDYYEENKEKIIEDRKIYYSEHKEEKLEYNKTYYKENKMQIKESVKNYRQNNAESIKIYQNSYCKERRQTDVNFRLRNNVSSNIYYQLKLRESSKGGQTFIKYLNYSMENLKEYLESQFEPWMNWDNYGKYNVNSWNDNDQLAWTWQLDHVIPQSLFTFTSMEDEEFKECWALKNLRPLSSKQNFLDGVNRTRH